MSRDTIDIIVNRLQGGHSRNAVQSPERARNFSVGRNVQTGSCHETGQIYPYITTWINILPTGGFYGFLII